MILLDEWWWQIIECMIIKFSPKGYYVLEPKHPYYETGKEYSFEFVKQEKDKINSVRYKEKRLEL